MIRTAVINWPCAFLLATALVSIVAGLSPSMRRPVSVKSDSENGGYKSGTDFEASG